MSFGIVWDDVGDRLYELGVKRGVLYPKDANGAYPSGVAWNGLSAVTDKPTGAESKPVYADDIEYLNLVTAEKQEGTIEAYTYPTEFGECDGSKEATPGVYVRQQRRKAFGFCYRTTIGNDVDDESLGYKLHLVWNAKASPSEKAYNTINEDPEAMALSWDYKATSIEVGTGYKPAAAMEIDSTKVDATKLAALEQILYGTPADATAEPPTAAIAPRLPLPSEIITLMTPAG